MQPSDEHRLLKFYKDSLAEFGDHDARSVHWADGDNQRKRFLVLSQIANLNNQRVLDVGCGLGDLYMFLIAHNIHTEYTGIDIVPDFINRAQKRFPNVTFKLQDIFNIQEKEQFDFVLASGALSFKVADNKKYYLSMISKMFELCKKGLAFNMLNYDTHVDDETFAAYNPKEIADFCKTLTSNVQIITGYLPQDFTVYMYKE